MPDKITKAKQNTANKFEPAQPYQRGYLEAVNGSVKVANRAGYVWVRDATGGLRQLFSPKVADTNGLPVLIAPVKSVGRRPDDFIVADVDWQTINVSQEYEGSPYYKNHAVDHEWRGNFPGADALTVYPIAWGELRTSPYTGLSVAVSGMFYFFQNSPVNFRGGKYDLSSFLPAAGKAVTLAIGLNKTTNAIEIVAGTEIVSNDLVFPPIPTRPDNVILSSYVKLRSTDTTISWNDIANARTFINDRAADGADELLVESILFNLAPTQTMHEGRLQWDAANGTLGLGLPGGNSVLQLGQELQFRAKCDEAGGLLNGQVIYVSDAVGGNPLVKKATASDYATAIKIFGVATEDIAHNQFGYITFFGLVRELDTLAFSEGDVIYLDTDGTYTTTLPAAPAAHVFVGIVLRSHATEGVMGVNPRTMPIAEVINYDNSTSGLTATDVQAAIDEIVSDSTGLNYGKVSKIWESDGGAVAMSADADGNIGIGIAVPTAHLQIKKTITNNTNNIAAILANHTFNGSGTGPQGYTVNPLFIPSASIANAYGNLTQPTFNPATGATLERAVAFFGTCLTGNNAATITEMMTFIANSPGFGTLKPVSIYGLYVYNQSASGVTTAYGIYIRTQTGATNNYAIFTNAGLNRLGDQLSIVGSGDKVQAIVKAATGQTTNLQEWQSLAGAALAYVEKGGAVKSSGRRQAVVTKTADYTATVNDEVIVFTGTTSATFTLPAATGTGQTYRICNETATAGVSLTIDGNASETIKGNLTQVLYAGEDLILTDYATGKWA